MFRILLAEDESKIAESIKNSFSAQGFEVDIAYDGLIAEKLFSRNNYSLCILDINLPSKNGLDLCKSFRTTKPNIPIIMLTAFGEIEDKLEAFSKGADDYMVKPFHFEELLARVKVFLKRIDVNDLVQDVIKVADLEIRVDEKKVFRGGKEISLSAKEFRMLTLLAQSGGKPLSKQTILEKVWDINFDTGTNTIEVYINFLRNKVDKPFPLKLIHTKQGFGYYLKEEE